MKKCYKLVATILLMTGINNADAQLTARIVAAQSDKHNGTTWQHSDSSRYIFNWGNNNPGDAMTTYTMKNDTTIALYYMASVYNPLYKHGYAYDGQGNMTQHIWFSYNAGNWKNYQNEIYTYDANGNVLTHKVDQWDDVNNVWKNFYLDSKIYSANKLVSDSIKYWDAALSTWYDNSAYYYTYSGDTVFHTFDTYDYPLHVWNKYSRYIDVYDANNNQVMAEMLTWHSWLNDYRESSLSLNTFNANNQTTYSVNKNWDTAANAWVNSFDYKYVYDANNVLILDSADNWSTATSSWVYSTATTHVHDVPSNTDTTIVWAWDAVNSIFKKDVRYTGEYNTYNKLTTGIAEHWITATSSWGGINNDRWNRYYYEIVNLSVDNVMPNQPIISLYPSPASNYINLAINWEKAQPFTVSIVDMMGRCLLQYNEKGTLDYKRTIPVLGLPAGNYSVLIRSGAVTAADRFTILR